MTDVNIGNDRYFMVDRMRDESYDLVDTVMFSYLTCIFVYGRRRRRCVYCFFRIIRIAFVLAQSSIIIHAHQPIKTKATKAKGHGG